MYTQDTLFCSRSAESRELDSIIFIFLCRGKCRQEEWKTAKEKDEKGKRAAIVHLQSVSPSL